MAPSDPLRNEYQFVVEEQDADERLDRYLAAQLRPAYSRSLLGTLIRKGQVEVNGRREKPSYKVVVGDRVVGDLEPPPPDVPAPEQIPLNELYVDEHLVVVDKPAGLIVHPVGVAKGGTLINGLLHRYPEIASVGPPLRPGVVHRLDRYTSGVMVVARSDAARRGLVNQFKSRTVKKEYRAVCVGELPLDSDYIDLPIGEDARHSDRMRIDTADGKPSSTFYEVVRRLAGFTELRVSPLTGRTHQIRVHLAHLGYPVIADGLYGRSLGQAYWRWCERRREAGRAVPRIHRQALHARRLSFTHPVDGRTMRFEAELPDDLRELLECLADG